MIKLQHMSVIFIIIMIPLVLVLSFYISTQIDTINLQTQYNTKLNDATHDAMEAFQINTRNNEYSTTADSLKRDVAASVNTFYTSLASNMGLSGAAREELQPYIPAVLFSMYDGFYLSSPTKTQASSADAEDVLKQYTYYTARYIGSNTDVTINYSLDSYISVYGKVNDHYVAKSGYLIQYGSQGLTEINGINLSSGITIKDSEGNVLVSGSPGRYIKDGKLYDDTGSMIPPTSMVYDGQTISPENDVVIKNRSNQYEKKDNRKEDLYYFIEAYEFTRYMDSIGLASAIDHASKIQINDETIYQNTGDDKITKPAGIFGDATLGFKVAGTQYNPENLNSNFVEHKRNIIRLCIENSLTSAFDHFEGVGAYDYELPKLTDEDWEKVFKNVSVVTFMQGLQVGSKIYNNYSVVTSTGNEEYIDPEEIYFIDSSNVYHRIGDKNVSVSSNLEGKTGYRSNMYQQQSKIITADSSGSNLEVTPSSGYILKEIGGINNVTADYDCIVNANYNSVYSDNGVLMGDYSDNLKQTYYTALARERQCLKTLKSSSVILNSTKTIYTDLYTSAQIADDGSTANINTQFVPPSAFKDDETISGVFIIDENGEKQPADDVTVDNDNKTVTDLKPHTKYIVEVEATDENGDVKRDNVIINTGEIKITATENWENGYIKVNVGASNLRSGEQIQIRRDNGSVLATGEKSVSYGGFEGVFEDARKQENNLKFAIIKDGADIQPEQEYTVHSKDQQAPTVDKLTENDFTITEDSIEFVLNAIDAESGFDRNNLKTEVRIFESNDPNQAVYISGEDNVQVNRTRNEINTMEEKVSITGLTPNTEYYIVIKIRDRLDNEVTIDTREQKLKLVTGREPKTEIPDAKVVVNPKDENDTTIVDNNVNMIAYFAPTKWVDGENTPVIVSLKTKHAGEAYSIQYSIGSRNNWTNYTGDITIRKNTNIYLRLVDENGIGGNPTTLNIGNIDSTRPTLSWKGNPTSAQNGSVDITITALDEGAFNSGIKSFKIKVNGEELPELAHSYNQEKNEGPKSISKTITISGATTFEVEVVDCVGRTLDKNLNGQTGSGDDDGKIKIEVGENLDLTSPEIKFTEVYNSNEIDETYANKEAYITAMVEVRDDNLRTPINNIPSIKNNLVVYIDNKPVLISTERGAGENTVYAEVRLVDNIETESGEKVQTYSIVLHNIVGNGNLRIELKPEAITDAAGNISGGATYNPGITIDNIAPTVNPKVSKTINGTQKKLTIDVRDNKEENIYQCIYEIKDAQNLKEEIEQITTTDIYTTTSTFGIYKIKVKMIDRAGNEGTSNEIEFKDYDITTKEDMEYFSKYVNAGTDFTGETINLRNDVDLQGSENNPWKPIGYTFAGTFLGNNYTIKGLYAGGVTQEFGLFNSNRGVIKSLTVSGKIDTTVTTYAALAGIVQQNYGIIENCTNRVNITENSQGVPSGSYFVGGIASRNLGTIKDSINYGTIEAKGTSKLSFPGYYGVGGIVGSNGNDASSIISGTIESCSNRGKVSGVEQIGGIAGINYARSSISNSYNTASIEGTSIDVGGITGFNWYSGTIVKGCYNTGSVSGKNTVGGIVGNNNYGSVVEDCYNKANITGEGSVGGVAGSHISSGSGSRISNCYSTGTISGTTYTGGVIGYGGGTTQNTYYLKGSAPGGINSQDVQGQAEVKTSSEMKNPEFVKTLGIDNWKEDTYYINNQYPILKWQDGRETVIITIEGKTTNSISVSALVTDEKVRNSSMTQYEYYIRTSGGSYSLKAKTNSRYYTFTGLKQNQTYQIMVIATNTHPYYYHPINGSRYEGTKVAATGEIPLATGNIVFSADRNDWTNQNVTVTMTTTVNMTGLKMQYQIGSVYGTWTDYNASKKIVIEKNSVIYGRLVDSEGQTNVKTGYPSFTVDKIDKVKPIVTVNDGEQQSEQQPREENSYPTSSAWNGTYDTTWYTNNTSKSTFEISTAEQFAGLQYLVNEGTTFNGKTIKLTKNINMGDKSFTPIGMRVPGTYTVNGSKITIAENSLQYKQTYFEGTFDGQNARIYVSLHYAGVKKIQDKANNDNLYVGLFYGNKGTIKNIELTGTSIDDRDHYYGTSYQGTFAIYSSGTIDNCINRIRLYEVSTADYGFMGGIAGRNEIDDVKGTIKNCSNYGTLSTAGKASGIAGGGKLIQNCYNYASIRGDETTGGISSDATGKIINCGNTNYVGGGGQVGGIIGSGRETVIENCWNTGDIGTSYTIGGIAGVAYSITNCWNTGNVMDGIDVGGIAGGIYYKVSRCANWGATYAERDYNNRRRQSMISASGGIVGENYGSNVIIEECYNNGAVMTDKDYAAGILGRIVGTGNVTIRNCYNTGEMEVTDRHGDLAAIVHVNTDTPGNIQIRNCYNISQTSQMVRFSSSKLSMNDITYKNNYTSWGNSSEYVKKVEEEMKQASFVSKLGDKFATDVNGINNGFPVLKWQNDPKNTIKVNGQNQASIAIQDKESGVAYWGVTTSKTVKPSTTQSYSGNTTAATQTGCWYALTNTTNVVNVKFVTQKKGTYYVWVKDKAGNVKVSESTLTVSGSSYINFTEPTWTNEKATVEVSIKDPEETLQTTRDTNYWTTAGGTNASYSELSVGDKIYARTLYASDVGEIHEYTVTESKAPTASISLFSYKAKSGTTYKGNVVISFSGRDQESGVQKLSYKIEGPENIEYEVEKALYTETVRENGTYKVTLTVTDRAGNEKTTSISFTINKPEPGQKLSSLVEEGDIIAYPTLDKSVTLTSAETNSGSNQTFRTRAGTVKCVVIRNSNGVIELAPLNTIGNLILQTVPSDEELFDKIANIYYNPTYAKTALSIGSEKRKYRAWEDAESIRDIWDTGRIYSNMYGSVSNNGNSLGVGVWTADFDDVYYYKNDYDHYMAIAFSDGSVTWEYKNKLDWDDGGWSEYVAGVLPIITLKDNLTIKGGYGSVNHPYEL